MKVYEHKTQYYETDQMGIIHHSNYIRWFEEARSDYLEQLGIGYAAMEERGLLIPVLAVQCEYKTMTHFGDTVRIEMRLETYDSVRMTVVYEVKDAVTDELRCIGQTKHCFMQNGRPVSLKRRFPDIDEIFKESLK